MMRGHDLTDAQDGQADGRGKQAERNDRRGEGFSFSMPVGMVSVGRLPSDLQATPDDERADHVEHGLDSVGDQCVRATDDAMPDAILTSASSVLMTTVCTVARTPRDNRWLTESVEDMER